MRGFRTLALGATALAVVLAACSSGGGSKPTIKVGSDGFYEAKLMAACEMVRPEQLTPEDRFANIRCGQKTPFARPLLIAANLAQF